jgi:hypothetical protein
MMLELRIKVPNFLSDLKIAHVGGPGGPPEVPRRSPLKKSTRN